MRVKDIMTGNVVAAKPESLIQDVANIMVENNVGSVPVCDNERVVGIITDRDIVLRGISSGKDCKNMRAKDIMTSKVLTATPEMDASRAADLMAEKQIRRLPVVENDKLVGIVSLGDMAVHPAMEDNAGEALSDISMSDETIF